MKIVAKGYKNLILTFGLAFLTIAVLTIITLNVTKDNNKNLLESSKPTQKVSQSVTQKPKITPSKAVIGHTGDMLIHSTVYKSAYNSKTNEYDFTKNFEKVSPYYKNFDYFVANLEVTLAGKERGYSSYPLFNCPDTLLDTLKSSGVDLLLTSNNHCYDTGYVGLIRTQEQLIKQGLNYTGTRQTTSEKPYKVVEVNKIKLGMLNYTYQTQSTTSKNLNGIRVSKEAAPLINSFDYADLDSFYKEVKENIAKMRDEKAEAIVVYIHWGDEYHTTQNTWQEMIAQKLCDLGVDLIVGGHPHVLQPIKVVNSSNSEHQTVCIYSTGNAIADQRRELMSSIKTGHTEDGVLFSTTFEKDENGGVYLDDISYTPTWTNKFYTNSGEKVQIIPLESKEKFLSEFSYLNQNDRLLASFERTNNILKSGVREFKANYKKQKLNK